MSENAVVKVDPRIKTVRGLIEQLKPQMANALPAHITADRMARVVMTQIQNNPYLLNCDRGSLLSAVMTGCQLGLEPDGILGHGYLVPFKTKVQFIPGYKGYIKLARQSGEISDLYAMDVREKDKFKIVDGLNRDLVHERAMGERGDIVGFYAVAKFINGGFDFKYMTVAEVNEIRNKSEGYKAFKAGKIKD
ncbi:MAG: recombinase RecT, partial [Dongiaceae bacterium]